MKGFSLVEVLLAVVVLGLSVTALIGGVIYGQQASLVAGALSRGVFVSEESLEASRSIRDNLYSSFTSGNHGLAKSSNKWVFSGSSDSTDIFTRQISIATASGDDNRRDATASVTWQQNLQRSGSMSLTSRFTDWHRQFGNWGTTSQEASQNPAGSNNAMALAQKGRYVYVVRDGGSPSFVVYDIDAPASPTVVASLTLTGNLRNIAIAGNYAYVVSTADAAELQIVDISNPLSPVAVGSFDVTGNSDASGVYAVGSTAYVTTINTSSNNFVIVNASTPSSPTQYSIMGRPGPLNELIVMGNYAYVGSNSDPGEIQVIDVSNPSSPTLVTAFNMTGTTDGLTITGFQSPDTVFVGRSDGSVYIVDVTTPGSPSETSSFAGGTRTNDVSAGLSSGYLVMATSNTNAEFRVLDISTLSTPTNLGVLNLANPLEGVIYDQSRDRVYAASQSDTTELLVIKPQ